MDDASTAPANLPWEDIVLVAKGHYTDHVLSFSPIEDGEPPQWVALTEVVHAHTAIGRRPSERNVLEFVLLHTAHLLVPAGPVDEVTMGCVLRQLLLDLDDDSFFWGGSSREDVRRNHIARLMGRLAALKVRGEGARIDPLPTADTSIRDAIEVRLQLRARPAAVPAKHASLSPRSKVD